jgi:hypothetical protein
MNRISDFVRIALGFLAAVSFVLGGALLGTAFDHAKNPLNKALYKVRIKFSPCFLNSYNASLAIEGIVLIAAGVALLLAL